MQITVYYTDQDEYLIQQIEELASRKRMSRSAVILSVIEQYFEAEKKLGQILIDMDTLTPQQLHEALETQKEQEEPQKLGELLITESEVPKEQINRALEVQKAAG